MTEIIELIIKNLILVGECLSVCVIFYLSNMILSLFVNMNIKKEDFDRKKILLSVYRIGAFIIGLVLYSGGITILPYVCNQAGWNIPVDVQELLTQKIIVIVILVLAIKYAIEALYTFILALKFTNAVDYIKNTIITLAEILSKKSNKNNINNIDNTTSYSILREEK